MTPVPSISGGVDPLWIVGREWLYAGLLVAAGFVLIEWALVRIGRPGERRCPRCRYDMHMTNGRRCPECGHVAAREALLRRRPRRWIGVAVGLLVAVAYPAWRGIEWGRGRGWTPLFGPWKVVHRVSLPGGVRAEALTARHPRAFGEACRVRWPDGTVRWFEEHRITLGEHDRDADVWYGHGDDVTGDGRPNLILNLYTGGAHCCRSFVILELTPAGDLREVTTIEAYHGGGFSDRDGDGVPEYVTGDWRWAYAMECFSCIRYPTVILRYEDGGYALAPDLMRAPAPDDATLDGWVREIEGELRLAVGGRSRGMLISRMLKLIYTGHESIAWDLADGAWPDDVPGRDHFLANFRGVLETTDYWEEIARMETNAWAGAPAPR